jgi:hypothetical protein
VLGAGAGFANGSGGIGDECETWCGVWYEVCVCGVALGNPEVRIIGSLVGKDERNNQVKK